MNRNTPRVGIRSNMILTKLDNLIIERWGRLDYNGTPIKVYPYLPDRGKGNTKYPSTGFSRIIPVTPIMKDHRPLEQVFIPSTEQTEIDVDLLMGGGTVTGPVSYTMKPYPTQTFANYEFHVLATDKDMLDALTRMMFQVIPVTWCPTIDDVLIISTSGEPVERAVQHKPVFTFTPPPENLDDLSLPEYRTSFIYHVAPLQIDRLEEFEVAAIEEMNVEFLPKEWT